MHIMMIPKSKPMVSKKLRDSARGEECTMNGPECNYNPETVVLCHSNRYEHGKGKGLKADDREAFYGCSGCNFWFDSVSASKDYKDELYRAAKEKTHERMREKGLGGLLDA